LFHAGAGSGVHLGRSHQRVSTTAEGLGRLAEHDAEIPLGEHNPAISALRYLLCRFDARGR